MIVVSFQMTSFGEELQSASACSNPDSCRHMSFNRNTPTELHLIIPFFIKTMSAANKANMCLHGKVWLIFLYFPPDKFAQGTFRLGVLGAARCKGSCLGNFNLTSSCTRTRFSPASLVSKDDHN